MQGLLSERIQLSGGWAHQSDAFTDQISSEVWSKQIWGFTLGHTSGIMRVSSLSMWETKRTTTAENIQIIQETHSKTEISEDLMIDKQLI